MSNALTFFPMEVKIFLALVFQLVFGNLIDTGNRKRPNEKTNCLRCNLLLRTSCAFQIFKGELATFLDDKRDQIMVLVVLLLLLLDSAKQVARFDSTKDGNLEVSYHFARPSCPGQCLFQKAVS